MYHGILGKWFLNDTSKKTMEKHGSTMVLFLRNGNIFQIPFTEKIWGTWYTWNMS